MKYLLIVLLVCASITAHAQLPPSPDSSKLIVLNQQIDELVVAQNVNELETLYANDYVFSHGSGRIEGKTPWLKTVARKTYPVRKHDSVSVQQHGEVAVVKGKMYIERMDKEKLVKYELWYIRVFAVRRNQWSLISHNTIREIHL